MLMNAEISFQDIVTKYLTARSFGRQPDQFAGIRRQLVPTSK